MTLSDRSVEAKQLLVLNREVVDLPVLINRFFLVSKKIALAYSYHLAVAIWKRNCGFHKNVLINES